MGVVPISMMPPPSSLNLIMITRTEEDGYNKYRVCSKTPLSYNSYVVDNSHVKFGLSFFCDESCEILCTVADDFYMRTENIHCFIWDKPLDNKFDFLFDNGESLRALDLPMEMKERIKNFM